MEMEIPEAEVGLIAGGIRTEEHKKLAQEMRKKCKTLIALGKEQSYLTYAQVNDHLPSEIVDPEGRIVQQTSLYTRTGLVGSVVLRSDMTFYAEHGDWFAAACLACALGTIGAAIVKGRKGVRA